MPSSFGLTFGELKRFHDVQLVDGTKCFVDPSIFSKVELWMYHEEKVPLYVESYEQWLSLVRAYDLNYILQDQGRGVERMKREWCPRFLQAGQERREMELSNLGSILDTNGIFFPVVIVELFMDYVTPNYEAMVHRQQSLFDSDSCSDVVMTSMMNKTFIEATVLSGSCWLQL